MLYIHNIPTENLACQWQAKSEQSIYFPLLIYLSVSGYCHNFRTAGIDCL